MLVSDNKIQISILILRQGALSREMGDGGAEEKKLRRRGGEGGRWRRSR